MKKKILLGVVGSMIFLFSAGGEPIMGVESGYSFPTKKFGVEFTTDKPFYKPGEKISMAFKITCTGSTSFIFRFNSGQRYDFVIQNEKGEEVWRWSKDRMFIQVLGEEKVGGARKSITYQEVFSSKLSTGTYRLTANLTSSNAPLTSTLTFFVNPGGKPAGNSPAFPLH